MGANFQTMTVSADLTRAEVKDVFRQAQDDDRYENGHSYSGGFGMATGLTFIDKFEFADESRAYEYLDEHCQKWQDALAVKFVREDGKAKWLIGAVCAS